MSSEHHARLPASFTAPGTSSFVEFLAGHAPHLLLHGTWDENVPIELSERYQQAATAADGRSALLALPRADHFDVVDPESPTWPAIEDAIVRLIGT